MKNYKLVACDLDGTLVSSDMSISENNKKAIKAFSEKGIPFVPCTGRTLSEMSDTVNNPDIRYYICSNGALIWDKKTNEKSYLCMSQKTANAVLDVLMSTDCYIIMHHDGKTYADARVVDRGKEEYNVPYNVDELICNFANIEENFAEKAYSMDNVESICVIFRSIEDTIKYRDELSKNCELLVVDGWSRNLEIFSSKASKGRALEILAKKLGIAISETIGIGDSGNDISMIKCAGLGLAMSNASESLKKVADEVICSNDEGVASYVLERYFM